MSLFRVQLRGEHFPGVIVGEGGSIGFYTTRFVEAASEIDAEAAAVEILKADPTLKVAARHRANAAKVFVENITGMPEGAVCTPNAGFTFFRMEEDPAGESPA